MSNLNHSFTQMYKIDTILQNLQFIIPSINQGLELTYRLDNISERLIKSTNMRHIWNL
jgi:hypothetical protein